MASLVKLKPFCKVFGKMAVVVASMSHVGKKPREITIFGFTSVVQITKWLLLAQKVHSTPITQQAEQSWLHTRREQMTCQSIFPEN
jgi:hypothetical protein